MVNVYHSKRESVYQGKRDCVYQGKRDQLYQDKRDHFNIPVSTGLPPIAHMLNRYEICLNITNYQIFKVQDFTYWLCASILDCFWSGGIPSTYGNVQVQSGGEVGSAGLVWNNTINHDFCLLYLLANIYRGLFFICWNILFSLVPSKQKWTKFIYFWVTLDWVLR